MATNLRWLIAVALLTVIPTSADAQTANIPGIFLSGSAPAGFSAQAFKMDCNNATPTSGQCWPLMEIYDASGNQATVNASDHGLTVHVANANTNGQTTANNSAPVTLPLGQYPADPCTMHGDVIGPATKTTVAFSSSNAEFQPVAPSPGNRVYICSVTAVSTAADSISIVEGTGSTCGTSPTAIVGSTTAANGMDIAANQGWQAGNGGASVYSSSGAGDGVCFLQSGTTKIAGAITYVQVP